MSFPGWSMDLHIRPTINTSNQQLSKSLTWSYRLSSMKPLKEGGKERRRHTYIMNNQIYTPFLSLEQYKLLKIQSYLLDSLEIRKSMTSILRSLSTVDSKWWTLPITIYTGWQTYGFWLYQCDLLIHTYILDTYCKGFYQTC